jgi:tetratricopeptide (TPR) repeat protein
LIRAAHLTVLSLLIYFALHPHGRVWGLNQWAFWGDAVPWIMALVLAPLPWLAPRVLAWMQRGGEKSTSPPRATTLPPGAASPTPPGSRGTLPIVAVAVVSGAIFWLFRAKLHFLGDGYQSLSLLAKDPPFVKGTAPLLQFVLPRLRTFLGTDAEAAALAAYQIVSITSGIVFMVGTVWFARFAFSQRVDRILFFALCATSGSMLLFFGYVENYAPFVALTAVTCFTAVAALEGKIRKPWVLLPAIPMIGAHAFGPLAIPAISWVLLSGSGLHRRWSAIPQGIRAAALAALLALAGFVVFRVVKGDMQVQLALLPISRTWYSADGYTLFSRAHLVDFANLLFQLFPGLLVVTALFAFHRPRGHSFAAVRTFLVLLLVPQWLAVFALDPKIGMARDWDLFAFAGVPLVILSGLGALRAGKQVAIGREAVLLAASLGLFVLGARVLEARSSEISIARFRAILELDEARSRTGRALLIKHFSKTEQKDLADAEIARYEKLLPQREMLRQADEHHRAGRFGESIRICREVLRMDPAFNEANMLLGESLLMSGDYEASRIMSERGWASGADASRCLHNLAMANAWLRRSEEAEKWWRKALEVDPDSYEINLSIAKLYETQGRATEFRKHLAIAARSERASPEVVERARELGLVP